MQYRVWLPVEEGIIGIEYLGYKTFDKPNTVNFCDIRYLGEGKGLIFDKFPVENISELERETTWQEQAKWYEDKFDLNDNKCQLNLLGLFNDMYDVGTAYHEMWNGWVGTNFYEMNSDLIEGNSFLVGISPAPYGCASLRDAVAFIAETDTGERFWSHGSKDWVDDMREEMLEIYTKYLKSR